MDLDRGFPRMRSLWGRVCVFLNQGVCMFIQWSMTLTYTLDGGMGLASCITSLWPPRILLPRLPRASPPLWFQADVLNSIAFIGSWSTVYFSVECPSRGFRSEWPASQSGSSRCNLGFWAISPRARMVVVKGNRCPEASCLVEG